MWRNYLEAIRRKRDRGAGQRAEAAGCRLAAVAPRVAPDELAGGLALAAVLTSLHVYVVEN